MRKMLSGPSSQSSSTLNSSSSNGSPPSTVISTNYHELQREKSHDPSPFSKSFINRIVVSVSFEKLLILAFRTSGLILLYYSFSIGITFYQKWFIKGFHYPLTVVLCHLIIKYLLASLVRFWFRVMSGTSRVTIPWSSSWKKMAVTGVASSFDIGFSNWSFEFITISLYTMTKSTCVIFILGFAILFGLEKKRLSLMTVVSLISFGLFMFTYKSTQFEMTGFVLVLSASFLGGLRWTLAQLLMQRKEMGLSNPVDMIYYIQPWMIFSLLPLVFWIEVIPFFGSEDNLLTFESLSSPSEDFIDKTCYILIGSILAFLMELSEYLLLTYTSSLTLSIAGIFKEVFTLFLAFEYNGDSMSLINFFGLLICMTGIVLHLVIKISDVNSSGKYKIYCNHHPETRRMKRKDSKNGSEDESEDLLDHNPDIY